jgi:DNA-damage-inducible protein D
MAVLSNRGIYNEQTANVIHRQVGENVREAIRKNNEIMPEDLPVEPHIKVVKKRLKSSGALSPVDEGN